MKNYLHLDDTLNIIMSMKALSDFLKSSCHVYDLKKTLKKVFFLHFMLLQIDGSIWTFHWTFE